MNLALGALIIFTGYVQKITQDELGRALTVQVAPELAYSGRRYLAPKVVVILTPGAGPAFSALKAGTYALFAVRRDSPENVETPIFSAKSPDERIVWGEPLRKEMSELVHKDRLSQTYWWESAGAGEVSAWQACSLDADCAVISGFCSASFPLNRRFAEEAAAYFKTRNAEMDCVANAPPPRMLARCRRGVCR